jgi:hypothetical protein
MTWQLTRKLLEITDQITDKETLLQNNLKNIPDNLTFDLNVTKSLTEQINTQSRRSTKKKNLYPVEVQLVADEDDEASFFSYEEDDLL